jgi:hypothetical protein
MSYARVYDFSITAGGTIFLEVPGNYYKIISSTGNLGTRRDSSNVLQPMFAGRGEKGATFQRLAITDLSGSVNTGQILIATDSEMVDSTFQAVGAISTRPEQASANVNNNTALVANTAQQLFAPGANANGAVLLHAQFQIASAAAVNIAMVANASAPANPLVGDTLVLGVVDPVVTGTNFYTGRLYYPQYIAAGQGLYLISDTSIASRLVARWKIL